VNKILLSASAVAALAFAIVTAQAQSGKPDKTAAAPAASTAPHKVALIDMAYVFKNYEKFKVLREDLKAEVEESENVAKNKMQALKTMQEQMKAFTENSPEYTQREAQLAKASAEFEAFRRSAQRDFLKKESQIYHTVYMDVGDLVKKYAQHYNYTLVMRFSREELDTENAQKLIEGMNRQVVYFREEDDITDTITDVLNRNFKPTPTSTQKPPTSTGTTPKPNGTANGTRPTVKQ